MTGEVPPRISVIDVSIAVTGKTHHDAAQDFRRLLTQYPEVGTNCSHFKFPGQGQRGTPVTDAKGIIDIIMLLPGQQAARVRRQAAELVVRYIGGDLSLVDEVCRNRGVQEELAVARPEDPRRVFGEVVEATTGGSQLTQILAAMNERMASQEKMLATIHERVEQDRQRVNLNVRTPKRAAPHQPQVARSIAGIGRPYPVARFLDSKEREDATWKCARRSYAPAFSMQLQVLKKKKLKHEGRAAVYIEQNHRPQLLYTEEDRGLMEEAWELTAAHREDLAGRPGNPQAAPMLQDRQDRPSVMDMLRGRE